MTSVGEEGKNAIHIQVFNCHKDIYNSQEPCWDFFIIGSTIRECAGRVKRLSVLVNQLMIIIQD
jgi:hypothetical protein